MVEELLQRIIQLEKRVADLEKKLEQPPEEMIRNIDQKLGLKLTTHVPTNKDIRQALAARNLKQWQLAEVLGIREEALSKMLRYELPDDEKQKMLEAINQIKEATT